MKKCNTVLSMMLVLSLMVFACDKKSSDDDNGGLGPSDLPFDELMSEEISFMIASVEIFDGELETFLMMFIKENHQNVTLQINGNEVETGKLFGYYFAEANLAPGQSFTYSLNVDGKTRSGSLEIPAAVQASFPPEFDLGSDYSYSWTTSSDPGVFVAFLDIDHDEDWIEQADLLNGNQRSHTFNRSLYSGLTEEEIWYIDVGIGAINFNVQDEMVFIGGFETHQEYEFNEFAFREAAKAVTAGGIQLPERGFPAYLLKRSTQAD